MQEYVLEVTREMDYCVTKPGPHYTLVVSTPLGTYAPVPCREARQFYGKCRPGRPYRADKQSVQRLGVEPPGGQWKMQMRGPLKKPSNPA